MKGKRTRTKKIMINGANYDPTVKSRIIPMDSDYDLARLWDDIVSIQVGALNRVIEGNILRDWEKILPSFGSSPEEISDMAGQLRKIFLNSQWYKEEDPAVFQARLIKFIESLQTKWVDSIMSILYYREDELLQNDRIGCESIFDLWDILFTAKALRKESVIGLNIIKL